VLYSVYWLMQPKKSKRSRVKVEDEQLLLPHAANADVEPMGAVSHVRDVIKPASQRRQRKRMHDGMFVSFLCMILSTKFESVKLLWGHFLV